ncbi:MAG: hypothetical protein ABJG47_02895 [Ekhidna sp.]
MKNLILLFSIASLIVFASCGDDDGGTIEANLSGTVSFNDQSYTISDGIFTLEQDAGNAVGRFFMSDGTLTATANGASASGASIVISMTAINIEASELGDGSYITSSNTEDMYVFVTITIIDGSSQDSQESFVGGTVTITGSGSTYNVTFGDVPFGQGQTLTGSVSGTFGNS